MVSHAKNSLDELRLRYRFLKASVKQDPNAASYVAPVAAYGPTWVATDQKSMAVEDAVADAQAGAIYHDRQLDALADDVWNAIHGTKKGSAPSSEGQLFFGNSKLHEFKIPVLGAELKGSSAWPGYLSAATLPALVALAPKAAIVVPAAEAAATALATAVSDLDLFEKGGELKAAFDDFNGLCTTVHAGLKAFALASPALKLGSTYADTFFMHLPRSSQPTTVGAAAELVKQLQQKLGVASKTHDDLVTKAKAQADAVALHDQAVENAEAKKKQADQLKKDAVAAKKAAAKLKPKKKK